MCYVLMWLGADDRKVCSSIQSPHERPFSCHRCMCLLYTDALRSAAAAAPPPPHTLNPHSIVKRRCRYCSAHLLPSLCVPRLNIGSHCFNIHAYNAQAGLACLAMN